MSKVLIRNADEGHVKEVVDEIFSTYKVDLKGKRVLIKPNLLGAYPPEKGVCTHPALVKAIVEACERQTDKIVVGDNPMRALGPSGVDRTAELSGIREAAGKYFRNIGAAAVATDIGSQVVDKLPLSKVITEVDYVINVPKFKTHMLLGMTVCMKNLYGLIPGAMKAELHNRLQHPKLLTQLVADLYKYRVPDLNIVDAIIGMEGEGPSHGKARRINKILAGTNGVEVDAVAAMMMGFPTPGRVKSVEYGSKMGLGEMDLEKIEIDGPFEVIPNFALPISYVAPKEMKMSMSLEENYANWHKIGSVRPELVEDKCIQCGECEEICPAGAMSLDPLPTVAADKCISCFCCAEGCPEGALQVPESSNLYERFFE
jgi:uncharacterized protein (DUF362 family)/formate hydrogenlyase subunit 6/NADH:ubiquinone oxidoreductase subunit I